MTRILFFGGTGYLGTALTRTLNDIGFHCFSVGRFYKLNNEMVYLDNQLNVNNLLNQFKPEIIIDGIRQKKDHKGVLGKSISLWITQYFKQVKGNTKLINLGSCAEYGLLDKNNCYFTESHPLKPVSDYGKDKRIVSKIYVESQKEGIIRNFLDLKIFNLYSEEPQKNHFPYYLKSSFLGPKKSVYVNNPLSVRDYMYLNDAVKFIVKLINKDVTGRVNICTGNGISNLEFASHYLAFLQNRRSKQFPDITLKKGKMLPVTRSIGCRAKLQKILEEL